MSKIDQNKNKSIADNFSGPTLQELELILNRIEELDAKHLDKINESKSSKQAA